MHLPFRGAIPIAIPIDGNMGKKELEKLEKYQGLKKEMKTVWKVKKQ